MRGGYPIPGLGQAVGLREDLHRTYRLPTMEYCWQRDSNLGLFGRSIRALPIEPTPVGDLVMQIILRKKSSIKKLTPII